MKRILTEEHKRKIKEALLKRVKEGKQKGLFPKGHIPFYTGKQMPMIQGKNHPKWKGGNHGTARTMLKRKGVDLTYCRLCRDKKNILIHHIDGNEFNNEEKNQAIICTYCHNAIHGIGVKTRFQKHQVPMEVIN